MADRRQAKQAYVDERRKLYETGKDSDILIKFGDQQFKGHTQILGGYWAGVKDNSSGVLNLGKHYDPSAVRALLRSSYTAELYDRDPHTDNSDDWRFWLAVADVAAGVANKHVAPDGNALVGKALNVVAARAGKLQDVDRAKEVLVATHGKFDACSYDLDLVTHYLAWKFFSQLIEDPVAHAPLRSIIMRSSEDHPTGGGGEYIGNGEGDWIEGGDFTGILADALVKKSNNLAQTLRDVMVEVGYVLGGLREGERAPEWTVEGIVFDLLVRLLRAKSGEGNGQTDERPGNNQEDGQE